MLDRVLPRRLLPALIVLACSDSAFAAGFQLQNQTGSGNGNAFAGAAAAAEDAGTVMWNPAGMTYLPSGHNISAAGTILSRSIDFSNRGSSASVTALGTIAPLLTTSDGGNAGGVSLIPAGYWTYSVSQNMSVGIGVSPTFGNKTEYDFSFVGRNSGYFAEITQININPSIAFKVNDSVSLGFGLNVSHNETRFKQGYPITAAPPVAACPPLPNCAVLNSAKNFVDIEGDDWGTGYNLGAMFQVTPATRIGLSYRSEIKFKLEGGWDAKTPIAGGAILGDQKIKAMLKTPANASLAVSHRLSDRWEILGDYTWTEWSVIDTLVLKNRNTNASVASLSYNFKDTSRFGLGGNYQYDDAWKLRFGIAYDKTPVKSAADRTMTLPDSDRTWLSFGAKYRISPASSLDFGYTHVFFAEARTSRAVASSSLGTLQTIRGTWNNSVDSIALQYNHNF